jgi:hypothetical protein
MDLTDPAAAPTILTATMFAIALAYPIAHHARDHWARRRQLRAGRGAR